MREFFLNCNIVSVWSAFNVDFTFCNHYTTRNGNNVLTTSVIDHFVVQPNILNDVSEAQVIHSGDNLSNHDPIFLKIKINSVPTFSSSENSDADIHMIYLIYFILK